MEKREKLLQIFDLMLARYSPQNWWPGETRFEMMVGAILTQAASWTNVEMAISNLKREDVLSPSAIRNIEIDELAQLVYPSGYYNAKARKLKALATYIGDRYADNIDLMSKVDTLALRVELLGVHGIGEETADDILLYALGKPTFVIDNYTKRLFYRLGIAPQNGTYAQYKALFTDRLPEDRQLFAEYHALIVAHGKDYCKKKPDCKNCCLLTLCPTGQAQVSKSDLQS